MATLLAYNGDVIGGSPTQGVSYEITLPTTGYTAESKSIWGQTARTFQSITITTDKNGVTMSNFHSGMDEDIAINLTGTYTDFCKLYAHEIVDGGVKFYFTSTPAAAFDVLIREAV